MWHLKRLPASEVALIDKSFLSLWFWGEWLKKRDKSWHYSLKRFTWNKISSLFSFPLNLKVAAECNVIWTQFMGPQVFFMIFVKKVEGYCIGRMPIKNLKQTTLIKIVIRWELIFHPQADHPVNVDSKSYKITEENMAHPDRWDMTTQLLGENHIRKAALRSTIFLYLVSTFLFKK